MHPTHGMELNFQRTEEQRKSVGEFIEFPDHSLSQTRTEAPVH